MIKVVTFNLRCANDPNGNSIDERAPRLKKVLAKYDADLVGFQEVTPRWMDHLTATYGEEYEIINQWRKYNNLESTPMMWRKARFECLDHGHFWLSDTPDIESRGWDSIGCYRICMWAKLRDKQTGEVFTFFNTHYGFGDDCQVKSGNLILAHMKAMGGPCFVTADFNMYPGSAGYKTLTAELNDCNAVTGNYQGCTYHGYHPEGRTHGPIDFCFATKDLISVNTSTLIDDKVDGMFPSDHYGFYYELELHQSLSVITFNVENNGAPAAPEARAEMLKKILRRYDADVVGLQEVTPVFEECLKKIGRYEMALKYRLEEQKEGTPILWNKEKFDLIHEEHFWLSETPDQPGKGFGGHYVRIATLLILQYKGTDRRFCYVNTHFDFGDENHKASAKLIAEKVAPYGDIPVFCTADFNFHIGSAGHKAMREYFKDTRRQIAPKDFTPTYNGFGGEDQPPVIIDFVFNNGVKVMPTSYKVIDEQPDGEYVSDHNGIYTTFILE